MKYGDLSRDGHCAIRAPPSKVNAFALSLSVTMSGKESGGYKSVLANIDTISSHLRANNAVKEALIMKFKKHRWLDPIATLDEMGLVKLVLDRISNDDSQYDIFVKMLRDTVGTDLIVEKLTGMGYTLFINCVFISNREI